MRYAFIHYVAVKAADRCQCGLPKRRGELLCRLCRSRLPRGPQLDLLRRPPRESYAFRQAIQWYDRAVEILREAQVAQLARDLAEAYRAADARLRGQGAGPAPSRKQMEALEQAARAAGLNTRELGRLALRGADQDLSDRALVERLLATTGGV